MPKIKANISFAFCECLARQLPLSGQCRNSGSNAGLVRAHVQLLRNFRPDLRSNPSCMQSDEEGFSVANKCRTERLIVDRKQLPQSGAPRTPGSAQRHSVRRNGNSPLVRAESFFAMPRRRFGWLSSAERPGH